MGTGELLLREILGNPFEDTPRLVYADWLEENGGVGRAVCIRWGIARGEGPFSHGVGWSARVFAYAAWAGANHEATVAPATPDVAWVTRRGFVEGVELPAAAFTEEFARELFSKHPVTAVRLTDVNLVPVGFTENGTMVTWSGDSPWLAWHCAGPLEPVFGLLVHHPRRYAFDAAGYVAFCADDAHPALSEVMVARGRELAGLPPLQRQVAPGGG